MSDDSFFESTTSQIMSHIVIKDVTTGNILVNQRGDIKHQQKMEENDGNE
jgi:hypothetical protein